MLVFDQFLTVSRLRKSRREMEPCGIDSTPPKFVRCDCNLDFFFISPKSSKIDRRYINRILSVKIEISPIEPKAT